MTPREQQSVRPPQRRLNALDQCMLSISDSMQQLNNPGFETLAVLWLESPLDTARLKESLVELRRRHPILTARLRKPLGGARSWDWSNDAEIPLQELTLASSDESAVLATAGEILSVRHDLPQGQGIAFHLLHLPDRSDVLLMRFNHALIDHQSATLILQELNDLSCGQALSDPGSEHDRINEYRHRFGLKQRLRAFLRTFPDYIRDRWLPRKFWPRMLSTPLSGPLSEPARLRILSRQLDADDVQRLLGYARRISRFPSTSLTILASVFRAFASQVREPRPDDLFRTGVGVEFVRLNAADFHPQNASSVLRLEANRSELQDRAQAVSLLHNRLLQELKDRRDLGILESNSLFFRCYPLVRRVSGQMIRWAFSFFYGFFSVPAGLSRTFAGIPLRQLHYVGPAWSPPGATLIATQFQDRIFLDLTYVEQVFSKEAAERLLDGLFEELREANGEPEANSVSEARKA